MNAVGQRPLTVVDVPGSSIIGLALKDCEVDRAERAVLLPLQQLGPEADATGSSTRYGDAERTLVKACEDGSELLRSTLRDRRWRTGLLLILPGHLRAGGAA